MYVLLRDGVETVVICLVLCCRIAIRRDAAIQKEIAKELSNKANKNEKDHM